jgi:hypothetical protein
VIVEPVILALLHSSIPVHWVVANLIIVQIGYVAGIFARGVLEHATYPVTSVRTRRMP